MNIVITQTKGGVGKTTLTLYLGLALHELGKTPVLIDADPQGSLTSWAEAADNFPLKVQHVNNRGLTQLPTDKLHIVDTPPGRAATIDTALQIADLVLIPTNASPIDLDRTRQTLSLLGDQPYTVILNGLDLRDRDAQEAKTRLTDEGIAIAESIIPMRAAVRRAYGTIPQLTRPYIHLAEEITEAI